MIETLKKARNRGKLPQLNTGHILKPIVNTSFIGERLGNISSKNRNKIRILSILFNIILEVLGQSNKARKRNKIYLNRKGKNNLFADNMIFYIENPNISQKK